MSKPVKQKATLWILRSPLPSLVRDYCRLHPELNLPLHLEVMTCNDILTKDHRNYEALLHTSTDTQPTNSLPIAALAMERGWTVNVIVLLPSPETLAKALKQSIPSAQTLIGKFRRPFPIPVSSFRVESSASGYWLAEPDMFSKLLAFQRRLREAAEQYPHLEIFEDLGKELEACLND